MKLYQKIQIHIPLFGLLRRIPKEVDSTQVLVLCDDALGDLLLMSGILKYLKTNGYTVTLVVRDTWKDIAAHLGAAHVIAVDMGLYRTSFRYRRDILNQVRHTHYAWAASSVFPSAINADLLTYCGARKRCVLKWNDSWLSRRRRFWANCKITPILLKDNRHVHADILAFLAHYYSAILGRSLSKEEIAPALTVFQPPDYPALLPVCNYLLYISDTVNKIRRYPVEKLLPVLRKYAQQQHLKIVVTAKDPNPDLASDADVINLTGKTSLAQWWQILFHAQVVVGNETGSTHLSWILGKPTLMIYGGGHYGLFRPNKKCHLVYHLMKCYGCSWDCCPYVPMDKTAPCIEAITPQDIDNSLSALMSGAAAPAYSFSEQDFKKLT